MEGGKEEVARFLVAAEAAATEVNKSSLNIKKEWADEDEAGLSLSETHTVVEQIQQPWDTLIHETFLILV